MIVAMAFLHKAGMSSRLDGSGLRGFCHAGGGMWSRVLRECFFSKCVCSMSTIRGGCVVISLVVGSCMASSLGWSLALDCRPADVLRLLW